jgi:RNA-directed DNA polymerase
MGTDSWHGLSQESGNGRRTVPRREVLKVKPEVSRAVLSQPWGWNEETSAGGGATLWGQIFNRENLFAALARVEANGGAPGVDGLAVETLRPYLQAHGLEIRAALDAERYRPQAVRRVEIPKPEGGMRLLGIPTVVDRLIQQAVAQVLTPLFDPQLSEHSYGFRPKRSAHQAMEAAQAYLEEGYDWVVDIDLEQFFDRVNHDALLARAGRVVTDRRVKRLIHLYLISGVMVEGVVMASEEGTPQGGPLSPLLSNILLDDVDQELERGVIVSCGMRTIATSTYAVPARANA